MKLEELSDAELGRIVREGPLWHLLLEMEGETSAARLNQRGTSETKNYT